MCLPCRMAAAPQTRMSIVVRSGAETHVLLSSRLAPTFCYPSTSTSILGTSQEAHKKISTLQSYCQARNEGLAHIQQRGMPYWGPARQRVACAYCLLSVNRLHTPREVLSQKAIMFMATSPISVFKRFIFCPELCKKKDSKNCSYFHGPIHSLL